MLDQSHHSHLKCKLYTRKLQLFRYDTSTENWPAGVSVGPSWASVVTGPLLSHIGCVRPSNRRGLTSSVVIRQFTFSPVCDPLCFNAFTSRHAGTILAVTYNERKRADPSRHIRPYFSRITDIGLVVLLGKLYSGGMLDVTAPMVLVAAVQFPTLEPTSRVGALLVAG